MGRNRPLSIEGGSTFSLHKREKNHTRSGTSFSIEITTVLTLSFQKKANFAIGGTTEHHRRLLVCFAGCSRLTTSEFPDDPLTLRIPETTIGAVCGKCRARNLRGDTQELGLQGDLLIFEAFVVLEHPTGPSELTVMSNNPTNLPPEDQFLLWRQEMEARQEEQARKVAELREHVNRLREDNESLRTRLEAC